MFLITAIFIGSFLQVLVYGAYVATFIRHVQTLARRRRKLPPRVFIYLSTASFLLFALATATVVTDLTFTTNIFKAPTEPIDFSGYGKKYNLVSGCILFSLMVSDAFLLYRSYVLYNSRLRVVALPLLVFMVECGIGIWVAISLSQKNDMDSPWTDRPQKLSPAETIFGFISEESKGLIIASMWRSHHRLLAAGLAPSLRPSAYVHIGAIIVNSAAINIVLLLGVFVTSSISSLVYVVFAAPLGCVTALIFSTIIVSASRPPSTESESFALVESIPPKGFPKDFTPSNATMKLSVDNRLEASIRLVESSSSLGKSIIAQRGVVGRL
ncbi:hypothetical protein BDP27DRAFT_1429799 [Rhodocollybia butyracea]|uniref:Uncharacterized protein n=1 Tax=Rhodocollybia butyracea TaxID=206335 RepID=A0A9P5PC96_9AGAR|nr:hypothetical protein BDP27DRAFT_1429799 [Rhodocollybia butyracea]